jgi:TonB family protein
MSSTLPPTHPVADQDEPRPTGAVVSSGWLASRSMFGSHDENQKKRAFGASIATIALHGVFLLLAILVFTYRGEIRQAVIPEEPIKVVYLQVVGPGGGGGGSPAPAAPKPIQIPKTKPPIPPPIVPPPPKVVPPPPIPELSAPIVTPNAQVVQASGQSLTSPVSSGGGGRGTGVGPGTGSGVGPGMGGNFGGGVARPGAGIEGPTKLKEVKPVYTSEAMRAKIQGEVWIEAVVDENGMVSDVRVVKSLDKNYGLDQEAMKAARMWLFRPAHDRDNKPVPILITMILDFRLH